MRAVCAAADGAAAKRDASEASPAFRGTVRPDTGDAPAFVYMVQCADGTLYSGWTNDVEKRVTMHNAGRGAKYTRSRCPVQLAYAQLCKDKNDALRHECALKRLPRAAKLALCEAWCAQTRGETQKPAARPEKTAQNPAARPEKTPQNPE
ncbi:MAG: GIY-YIG nuclease family protein [Ruthenibacterium sp.]